MRRSRGDRIKKTNYIKIASLVPAVCASFVHLAAGCSGAVTDEQVGAAESALDPSQCEYFDVNGTVGRGPQRLDPA
ncbi:hypothetical protein WMF20_32240 [Sorangium sp. So ce834]|uniref:hypothetical protein n=1 Tax=Sorangium sp. So ce834 TaxID=3133321 RepID=UPI003F62BAAC